MHKERKGYHLGGVNEMILQLWQDLNLQGPIVKGVCASHHIAVCVSFHAVTNFDGLIGQS